MAREGESWIGHVGDDPRIEVAHEVDEKVDWRDRVEEKWFVALQSVILSPRHRAFEAVQPTGSFGVNGSTSNFTSSSLIPLWEAVALLSASKVAWSLELCRESASWDSNFGYLHAGMQPL